MSYLSDMLSSSVDVSESSLLSQRLAEYNAIHGTQHVISAQQNYNNQHTNQQQKPISIAQARQQQQQQQQAAKSNSGKKKEEMINHTASSKAKTNSLGVKKSTVDAGRKCKC